jgi:hypothetical protein
MGKLFAKPRAKGGLILLAAVMVLACALFVAPAFGVTAYEHGTATTCSSCHPGGDTSKMPTNATCATCHTGYQVYTGSTETCWTCHLPGQNMTADETDTACAGTCHMANGDTRTHPKHFYGSAGPACTTCHNLPTDYKTPNNSPHHDAVQFNITQKATIKASPATVKFGGKVAVKGGVTPNLAAPYMRAGKVTATFQRKSGAKWVKIKAVTGAINGTTGAYSISYKPAKKGSWRVQAKTPASVPFLPVTTTWKTFKVS